MDLGNYIEISLRSWYILGSFKKRFYQCFEALIKKAKREINAFEETSVLRIGENDELFSYLASYVQQHVNHESSYLQV